eukprot:g16144.t1
MLDNEPRLAFLADIEREAGEKSKQMKTLLEQVTALKQENAKVVADLGESEQHAKNYMEKMNDMDNHNAELDEQLRNLAQRVATAEADHQREVQKLRNDHQLAVMELDQQHASVHRDHEQKVLEMHTLLAKSNAENQSLLTKMQEQHQSELSQLRSEHQQERLSLMEWNRNALLDVETDKHKAILSMGKLHEEGLTKEMTGLKDTIAAQEATILNDSVVKKELERELEKYKHVATDYEAATEQMRADAKKEAAEEVFSLRSQLQAAEALTKTRESEKADLETRLQDTLAELAKETEKLRSSSREQLADADKKRKEALEELKAEYEEKIEQLTADHEAEIAATQKKLEEQSGKLRKTRTNLETTESEMKKSLHDQFNAEFEKQERDFAQQMEKLEREKELYEKRQATLLAQHNEKCWRLFTFGVRFKSLGTLAQNDMQSMIGIIVRPTPQRGRPREQKAMQDMRERPPWVNVNESAVDTTASATTSSASRAPLPADDLHLGIWKEMQHWRQSIAQPLEDQFFGLSQPEWASPHSRKLINSLWQQACQTLKVLHGKWVAAVSSAFDSQGSAFLHQLKTERARMEHLYDKTWREKILPQGTGTRPHDHVQNRNGGSKLRQPARLLPSTSAESSFSLDELHARLEALPAPRMKDRRDAQYRKIQQRNILELWRDAVLLQPAVVDLVAEIKADVDRGVPASSGSCTSKALAARSRMYSLSKPMGRAIEKLVFTAASGRSSRTTRACNLDDVARCCLVVPDLDGIGRVIEYLERAQASGTVSTFFVKDRMSSPAPAVASCSAAGAGAGGDAKKWRDVLLYCAFNKKVDVLFELQLILSPMAAVDQRHGEFFDSARFFDEALAL